MQDFQQAKIKEVKRMIENCYAEIDLVNKNRGSEEAKLDQLSVIEEDINGIINEVNELAKYTRINFTALVKIIKKHDKNVPFMLKPVFTTKMNIMPFFKESFDALLIELSRLYRIVRDGGKDLSNNVNPQSGNGQTFVRQTTKYWVHPDNVMELKLYILKNLPVLVYSNDQNKPVNPAITSIYFDNSELDLYKGRIEKIEGAEAIRLRWYGGDDVTDIFIERKTHREDWTGEKSVKERFPLKEKHVNSYLAGVYDLSKKIAKLREEGTKPARDIDDMERLSVETFESVKNKNLVPVLRTFYNRTAFQLPGDATVRISLDTELSMIREDNFDGIERAGLNWRRTDIHGDYPFPQLPERDICRFPYAVLEVKLQTERGAEPPKWVVNLINSHLVESVPKFSKFIHGVSTLLEDRVDILPFWVRDFVLLFLFSL
ncbi:Vacuolar transporter chaperone 4 [Smittium mucronatum]|uniref:Vacuolar transporter chaperone complex subunit 4 n=1 Tax=Smittium mucronatum TaxID=133383 RepID=A0A1R0H7J4_9FUNG|nr:Vacuolar transporter chaperone 4 [Smittium mucronatum]